MFGYRPQFLSFSFLALIFCSAQSILAQTPPFGGTIFLDPDIITESDPTTFQSLSYAGQADRVMFDRRAAAFITVNAHLFDAIFEDGRMIEIQVNPEFGDSDTAMLEAEKYAPPIGQLPAVLLTDVETVWIHRGVEGFGGGNNNILIHTGQADLYINDGILEETLVHEASHTSLDAAHAASTGWLSAQSTDNNFISTYARDNPNREDVAESFLLYLAVQHRADRIAQDLIDTTNQTIPNRLEYFKNQAFDLYPIVPRGTSIERVDEEVPKEHGLLQNYPNPFNPETNIGFDISEPGDMRLAIYDLDGKEIVVLAQGSYPAGRYRATWDASGVASGTYIYRLQSDGFSDSKKMQVQK